MEIQRGFFNTMARICMLRRWDSNWDVVRIASHLTGYVVHSFRLRTYQRMILLGKPNEIIGSVSQVLVFHDNFSRMNEYYVLP